MDFAMDLLKFLITAMIASSAYGMVFDLKGSPLFFGALGGGIGWVAYKLLLLRFNYAFAFFVAAVIVAVYAEVMARIRKMPASVFILVGMLPLVPGEGIYLTMKALVDGNTVAFMNEGRHTFAVAGALSLGILLVSSVARLVTQLRVRKQHKNRAA